MDHHLDEQAADVVAGVIKDRLAVAPSRPLRLRVRLLGFRDEVAGAVLDRSGLPLRVEDPVYVDPNGTNAHPSDVIRGRVVEFDGRWTSCSR
jgi:hypothetical protein